MIFEPMDNLRRSRGHLLRLICVKLGSLLHAGAEVSISRLDN